MPKGRYFHHTILTTAKVPGEGMVGWVFHYLTGILFAGITLVIVGIRWLDSPTLFLGVLSGGITLAAPWILLQPALGFGIAASRTPRPWLARLLSVLTHGVFGIGLYLSACLAQS